MPLRAVNQLRENLKALLAGRHIDQKALAFALRRHPTWINKFLKGTRTISMQDLDGLADVFGLSAFELFRPGISALTERRKGLDRRTGRDRRVSTQARLAHTIQQELTHSEPPHGLPPGVEAALVDVQRAVSRVIQEANFGRQTARVGAAQPFTRPRGGTTSGSTTEGSTGKTRRKAR